VQSIEENEVKEGLIFKMEKGVPILKADTDKPVKLNNKITLKLEELKAITNCATSVGTEFYSFNVTKDKAMEVRVGDLHDVSTFVKYKPKTAAVETKEEIAAIFTKGLNEISKTLTSENVELNIKTDSPIWISSIDKNYRLGFLLPPYLGEEEEEE
jgi:hypothetical protein